MNPLALRLAVERGDAPAPASSGASPLPRCGAGAVILVALLTLAGCADRFVTEEQDAEFKRRCSVVGCAVVPMPVLEKMLRQLKGMSA